jgi:hypothetical protein
LKHSPKKTIGLSSNVLFCINNCDIKTKKQINLSTLDHPYLLHLMKHTHLFSFQYFLHKHLNVIWNYMHPSTMWLGQHPCDYSNDSPSHTSWLF